MARSGERRALEEQLLATVLGEQIRRLSDRQDWEKLACLELLFVRCWTNQSVAARLNMTEQAVASVKFEFVARLRILLRKQELPEDVFPELCEAKSD
jgi:RNA polymerase sigma-70 factor, ECF subfamily